MSCSLPSCTLLILLSLVCSPVIPFVSSLSFNTSSFDTKGANILLEGVAKIKYSSVDLTSKYDSPFFPFQVGRIQYSKPIDIWDSVTGKQADFSTRFSVTIDTYNSTEYSDGIAFFLAPVGFPVPPNSAGGFLGLFNWSTYDEPRNQIVMVEFDTYANQEYDRQTQHIGINNNSLRSLKYTPWNAGSHSGKAADVIVTYNSTSKDLNVSWSFDDKPISLDNKTSSLSCQIDLAKVLPEAVAIGFSASYGPIGVRHNINSWEFTSNLDVVGRPSVDPLKKGVRKKYEFRALTHIDKEILALPLQFSYQELLVATNGFANNQRLGQGGSSQVYKGFLNRLDRLVAIKRIFAESKHSEKLFTNEVKILSRMIHRNLVQFIGWCQEQGEFLLVYEYMPNGSLDNHLFGTRKSLPWDVRYKIASGLALALDYLHEDLEQCVLHRDIKAANILLDTNFNTKLGDFGVAKLIDPRFKTQTTDVVGTFRYLAPEYLSEGKVTKESDMFSFGVVALEIARGRRTYQEGEYHVPLDKWVWQLSLAGNMLEAVDETLGSSFDRKEIERLMMVGLWCVHPDPKMRPKAGQVVRFLQLEVPVPEFPRGTYEAPTSYPPSALRMESSFSTQEISSFLLDRSWLLKPSNNTC
ncbi:hypothetical protein EUGRSUZ_G02985 [Eucalyptus grandis]|uniref:Uncharacterized protein n=2 Tax=Eucalyptus grandis TaxID=71139 RepID=A0ACC3K8X1_EUCGR|nr:hypothetical protein EUGRSUZ_G02985 [Eucalyptus grandis]